MQFNCMSRRKRKQVYQLVNQSLMQTLQGLQYYRKSLALGLTHSNTISAICTKIQSPCRHTVTSIESPLGPAGGGTLPMGFLQVRAGTVSEDAHCAKEWCQQRTVPSGSSVPQQLQFTIHSLYFPLRLAPWMSSESHHVTQPAYPALALGSSPHILEGHLHPSLASPSMPAPKGRHRFKSSINADNCCIKLRFIIFSGAGIRMI